MDFIKNFPFFSIIICLVSGVLTSVLKKKAARYLTYTALFVLFVLSSLVLFYTIQTGDYYVYRMGHYFAPWGNEIRIGVLEGIFAVFFCIVMLLSIVAGEKHIDEDVESTKINLYYTLICLMMSSLLALTYTNDLFTAYVFIEINTITAACLVSVSGTGRSLYASTKYMIMSLLGSGLVLIGITLLYDVTGHLLLSNIHDSVETIMATGEYAAPMTIIIALITIGLSIKSALFPFHSWLPDAHTASTISSSAILSGLVLKGYIIVLIKFFYRSIGWENVLKTGINDVIFVFGIMAMIVASLFAIVQKDIKRMVAYSSVAQIGYIFMGLGIGNEIGVIAAIFQIFAHGVTKSMIFISIRGFKDVSEHSTRFDGIKGAALRNKVSGVAFAAGAFSMVGIPFLPGFVSKLNFAAAAGDFGGTKMIIILVALAFSTILNCIYFFNALITLYTPVVMSEEEKAKRSVKSGALYIVTVVCFILVNVFVGTFSAQILDLIESGLKMFS
ncbi:MAG: sodium:proton antiporter [Lachnospiraceae bacterium]|nr:sodium:proton antiporter [Lachnospiraceae bacterium]